MSMTTATDGALVRRTQWVVGWVATLLGGLVTTAAAMAGVYWAEAWLGEPVMSAYVYHLIPIGAIVIGLVAASGYLLTGHRMGLKVGHMSVWVFVALQVVAYFLAHYIEFRRHGWVYRGTGERVGFWSYFDMEARSYVWRDRGEELPMGANGYLLRALEIAAFAAGAGFMGLTLTAGSHCGACGRYRKTKKLAAIPAGEFLGEVSDETSNAELEKAIIERGREVYSALAVIAEAGDAGTFRQQVAAFPARRWRKDQGSRLDVQMTYCPGCMEARMLGTVVVKKGNGSRVEMMEKRTVPVGFVEAMA